MNTASVDAPELPPELIVPSGIRRDVGDAWLGWVFAATVLAAALAYSFRFVAFAHAKEAALGLGASLAAAGLLIRGGVSWRGFRAFAPLWLGLIVAVALGLGPALVRVPWRTVEEALRLALLLSCASMVFDLLEQRRWRARFRNSIIASSTAAALLGLAQYAAILDTWFPAFAGNDQRIYSVFGNQDLFGGYLALGLALLVPDIVSGRKRLAAGLAVSSALLAALLLSGSRSAWLAMAVGILVGLPRRAVNRRAVAALTVALTVAGGVTALAAPERTYERVLKTFSASDTGGNLRLWFWDGAVRMAADAPITGVGLDNFAYWSPHYQARALSAPGGENHAHNELHTAEPHSEPLRILAESGITGLVFIGWMLIRLCRLRGPEWGALAALGTFSLFNGAFLSVPHALAGLLLAGMLLAREKRIPLAERDSVLLAVVFAVLLPALAAGLLWTRILPSYQLVAAENAHMTGEDALPFYERALAHPWPSPEGREEYGMALWENGDVVQARVQFELALEGLDTGRVYLLLARAADMLGDAEAARRAYMACLWRWPSNKDAWRALWRLSDDEDRPALRAHAARWNIPTQKTLDELVHAMPEQP